MTDPADPRLGDFTRLRDAQLVLAFEMCQEIADELGVRHIDTIGTNFSEMLPDEG